MDLRCGRAVDRRSGLRLWIVVKAESGDDPDDGAAYDDGAPYDHSTDNQADHGDDVAACDDTTDNQADYFFVPYDGDNQADYVVVAYDGDNQALFADVSAVNDAAISLGPARSSR